MRSRSLNHMLVFALATGPAAGQVIHEHSEVLPPTSISYARFGYSVAMNSDYLLVGSPRESRGVNAQTRGAAYLFDAVTGEYRSTLIPHDETNGAWFGTAVAVSGPIGIVGAGYDSSVVSLGGSAYSFDLQTGTEIAKLVPIDLDTNSLVGWAVAIDGGTALVGARNQQGSVYVGGAYLFDAHTGVQLTRLNPTDGLPNESFGAAVAIAGTVAAVGSPSHVIAEAAVGAVYLFDVDSGEQLAKVIAADGEDGDSFGTSVAISERLIAVGAPTDDDNGPGSGSLYLFDAQTHEQVGKIIPLNGRSNDRFGTTVCIAGDYIIVGAPNAAGDEPSAGAAYVFDADSHAELAVLRPTIGYRIDNLGDALAAHGASVVAGLRERSARGRPNAGVAIVFDLASLDCVADLAPPFGTLDASDVQHFVDAFLLSDPSADLSEPFGTLNFFDLAAYLSTFNAGCP